MRHRVRAALVVSMLAILALPAAASADATSYRSMVMGDQPSGYWRLDEGSGPLARNEVGGGQRARYANHPLLDEDGALAGSRGVTAGFRSLIDLGPPVGPDTDATYETWFRIPAGFDGQNYEGLLEIIFKWGVWVYDGNIYGGCANKNWTFGPHVTDGKWHHVAVRMTAQRIEIFADGVKFSSDECDYVRSEGDHVFVGWGGGRVFTKPMPRTFDEVATYDRALSDATIASHAAARTPADAATPGKVRAPLTGGPYTSAVLADQPFSYYRLEDRPWRPDGSHSMDILDSSAHGRHGTMQLGGIDRAPGPIASEQRNLSMRPRTHGFVVPAPGTANLTVESWVKFTGENPTQLNEWVQGGRFGLYFFGEELSVLPFGVVTFLDNYWNDHAWHHVVVTKDANADEIRVYRDGVLLVVKPEPNDSPMFGADNPVATIGGGDAGNPTFCMDEVALYDRVLSASRVATHYDAADAELAKGGCGGTSDVRPDQRPARPVNTSPPVARGIATPGHQVFCDPGEWSGNPSTFRQLWYRDGDIVSGEWSYLVTARDDGHVLTCRVVATGPGGDSLEASSGPVSASGRPAPPGVPRLTSTGDPRISVDLVWDPTPPLPVPADGYIVQYSGADGVWHVASRPPGPSATLGAQPEGTLRFRVIAQSGGTESDPSPVSAPIVVDRTPPRPARLTLGSSPAWTSPGGDAWYRDSVTGTWSDDGDPDLVDGSPGSGVDPASVPGPVTLSTTGTHSVGAQLRDRAGNQAPTTKVVRVDADAPTLTLDCPSVAYVGMTASAVANAGDGAGSGLDAATPALVPVNTATIGTKIVSLTVKDNVGHQTSRSCSVPVIHRRPGAPQLVAGTSPGNGAVTIGWSRPAGAPAPAAYVLEARDANDAGWIQVARTAAESYSTPAGSPLAQGTWTFRVRIDDPIFDPTPSDDSSAVVVDRTAPSAPTTATDRPEDAAGGWFRDTVTVSFDGAGDPSLPDGSPGSGVNPPTIPASTTYSTAGTFTATGTVRDRAGNTSVASSRTVRVDTSRPAAAIACPAADVIQDSSATAAWTASDTGSGLTGAASGTVALATGAVGTFTVSAPTVTDKVGHVATAASCSYRVIYDWDGFLDPVSNDDVNTIDGGDVAPILFRLNGDRGLGVLAGTPTTAPGNCSGKKDAVQWSLPSTWTGLRYFSGTYVWAFPTQASWRNTCRELTVTLDDGTTHTALFRFK
jgi:concanavalin A-like lectin/glucanase superfamily protein